MCGEEGGRTPSSWQTERGGSDERMRHDEVKEPREDARRLLIFIK
jgi:hypothetical protein